MKPEARVEIILWDWFKTKGQDIIEVYFNRKNLVDAPVFNTKGINKKPDMIIKFSRGYGDEYLAVEVKPSTKSKDVHDSGKILSYYENYITKKTIYFIDDKEIEIKHFAVATENSVKGHLFQQEYGVISNETQTDDEWRKANSKYDLIPKFEGLRSSDYQRRLWSEWRSLKKRLAINKYLPSIGIIISNIEEGEDKEPYFFTMVFIDWLNKKPKWGQRFWRL